MDENFDDVGTLSFSERLAKQQQFWQEIGELYPDGDPDATVADFLDLEKQSDA